MGPSRSHSTVPSPWDSSPAVPFAGLRGKGTSPCLGHPPRSRSASHLLTLGVDGVGEQQEEEVQEEPGREPTRGLSAKGAWKSLVRYGCGSMEASSLHGFFLPLGTSAELHLRQLDVPNHIGVCGDRKQDSGMTRPGLWWCLQRSGQELGLKLGDRLDSFTQGPFCLALSGSQMPGFSTLLLSSKCDRVGRK